MKILIIGSRGMLGKELVNVFGKEKDFEVVGWDKGDCDITKKEEIQGRISVLRPDILINAAAYNDVDGAEKEPEKANLVNGLAVGFLAEIAEKLGILMIHYSTDYVFRGDKKEGYTEEDIPDPQSVYAKSKFLGEQELRNCCSQYYLIRLSRLFGKMGDGEGVKKSFVDKMIELSAKQNELKLIDEEVSSPTYAPDAAKLTFEIVKNKRPFGIYHGANSGACTWYEFAVEIFKILGNNDIKIIPVSAAEFPRPAIRPKYSILLNTKLPKQRPWQEAVKEYLGMK
jgi:dTDP-4-dehydrorhamnose reductase